MQRLPAVLLHHATRTGSHYDWLLADPRTITTTQPTLWAARVAYPSSSWLPLGSWALQPIKPHRWRYLTYQGPLTDQRGQVRRIDQGWFVPLIWTDHRKAIDLQMTHLQARIEIHHTAPQRCQAVVSKSGCASFAAPSL